MGTVGGPLPWGKRYLTDWGSRTVSATPVRPKYPGSCLITVVTDRDGDDTGVERNPTNPAGRFNIHHWQ